MERLRPDFKTARLSRELGNRFSDAQEELYLVGGAVRDALLGVEGDEADFATSAPPSRTFEILSSVPGAHAYRVGEKYGTIGAVVDDLRVEITTYRADQYEHGSRKPEVTYGGSLLDDLRRRDFTINAIAAEPGSLEIVDPLQGRQDLQSHTIRAVGNASERFREDPLRLLRAVRFAARLDFTVEAGTWEALQMQASTLRNISRERVRDEYTSMLVSDEPSRALKLLLHGRLLEFSVPELLQLTRMADHGPRHPLSLWEHAMRVLDRVAPKLELRWAALLHDIAKPATRTHEQNGRPRFFNHEEVGADVTRAVLSGLRYSRKFTDDVAHLVATHMQIHGYSQEWTDGAVRRLMIRMGACLEDAIELARADAAGHTQSGRSYNESKFDALQARISELDTEPIATLTSPLNGEDLMNRYDRPPGPWIARVKDALVSEVIEGRLARDDRNGAFHLADRLLQSADQLS